MSDRVDEQRREEQRIEAQRLQRAHEGKKQAEVKETFAKVVKNIREAKGKENRDEAQRQSREARGQAGLLARRGIENRGLVQQAAKSSENRLQSARKEATRATDERALQRGLAADEELARNLSRRSDAAGQRGQSGEGRGEGPRESREHRTETDKGGPSERQPGEVVAVGGPTATLQAIAGVGSKETSTSGAGLHTDLQQIIDELVEAVHRGVDRDNFGFMHIELKSHILSGSSLSLQSTREGVHLKITTEDDEVARLLSSGATAKELGQALDGRGVKLASFEVNQARVLG